MRFIIDATEKIMQAKKHSLQMVIKIKFNTYKITFEPCDCNMDNLLKPAYQICIKDVFGVRILVGVMIVSEDKTLEGDC